MTSQILIENETRRVPHRGAGMTDPSLELMFFIQTSIF